LSKNDILYRYWEYALPRLKEKNPNLFLRVKPLSRNALNGKPRGLIQFNCLANRMARNIPSKTIAVELYIDVKGKKKGTERIGEIYRFFDARREEIESHFPRFHWRWSGDAPKDDKKIAASIVFYRELDFTEEKNWKECAEFHAGMIKKLYDYAFLPYEKELESIMNLATFDRGDTKAKSFKKTLFCNIAWMKYYDAELVEPMPESGGAFVKENGYGFERNNFHIFEENGRSFCRGYVEPGHKTNMSETDAYKLNIARIGDLRWSSDYIEGATIIFCATNPRLGEVLIGWYKNAKVFREVQTDSDGNYYNIESCSADCMLLPEEDRTFVIPRSGKKGAAFGFGRSNVWYADDEKSCEFVSKVLEYINQYKQQSISDSPLEVFIPEELESYSENGGGKRIVVNRYERNPNARRECLRIHGYRCAVCGFDSASVYGKDFENRIEVHHIVPISERGEAYKVNPRTDLIPVCPNCHAILHTKTPDGNYLKWEELKERIRLKR